MDTSCSISTAQAYGQVDTKGMATLIASKVPLVILDARNAQWDDGKRIATAQVLTNETTPEQAAKLIPTKQSLVIIYCSNTQCGASERLAKRLSELGYSHILKYKEGIESWIHAGYPVCEPR